MDRKKAIIIRHPITLKPMFYIGRLEMVPFIVKYHGIHKFIMEVPSDFFK